MTEQTLSAPAAAAAPSGAPSWGGLLRSELRRARSRRSLWWMAALTLLGVLAVSAILFMTSSAVNQADIDAAADRSYAEQLGWYEECMADPGIPEADKDQACWKPTEEEIRTNAIYYVSPAPFTQDSLNGLMLFAGGIASIVALLIGASAGGADWGARTMGLLFSWEPRRLRVFVTRLLVVVGIGLVVTAAAIALALATGSLIASVHGLDPSVQLPAMADMRQAELSDAIETALRWLPLGALAAAGGFAVAMATRSTGWAIGATIALIMLAEPLVQVLWPWGSQWLVQTNVFAWLSGGMEWVVNPARQTRAGLEGTEGTIFLSADRAMTVMVLMVVVVLVAAGWLLRNRDVD